MQNLWQEQDGACVVAAGARIDSTIAEAISLSVKEKRPIKFKFNGVTVTVCADSSPGLIYRDWSRALGGYIDKNVGPYPNPTLTDEEKANDARIEAENESERRKQQMDYEARARVHREKVEARLVNAPAIELSDEAGWQKFKDMNKDGYGGAVVTYSERWARLMQLDISAGKSL